MKLVKVKNKKTIIIKTSDLEDINTIKKLFYFVRYKIFKNK